MKIATLNEFNDIVCPYCHVNIILDKNHWTSIRYCECCGKKFEIVLDKEDDCPGDDWPTIE